MIPANSMILGDRGEGWVGKYPFRTRTLCRIGIDSLAEVRDTANVAPKPIRSEAPFTKSDFTTLLARACETPSHQPAPKSKRKPSSRNRGGYSGTSTRQGSSAN